MVLIILFNILVLYCWYVRLRLFDGYFVYRIILDILYITPEISLLSQLIYYISIPVLTRVMVCTFNKQIPE